MDFSLGELHQGLKEEAARFAAQVLLPRCEHIEAEGVSAELFQQAGELGFVGLLAAESVGGMELDPLAYSLVTTELAMASPSFARLYANHAGPGLVAIQSAGLLTSEHVEGRERISFSSGGLTPRPTALVAIGHEVFGAFDAEEVDAIGHRGAGLVRLSPSGEAMARSPEDVSPLDDLGIASLALGSGRSAIQTATKYALERKQFKRPIADFQAIQWKIADAETEIAAAESLVFRAALDPSAAMCGAARRMASRAALSATDHAIQMHGGYGYTAEYPVERHYRSARMCAVGADTQRQHVYAARG